MYMYRHIYNITEYNLLSYNIVSIYIHTHIYIYNHIYIYASIYAYIYIYTTLYIYTVIYMCVHTCTHTHTHDGDLKGQSVPALAVSHCPKPCHHKQRQISETPVHSSLIDDFRAAKALNRVAGTLLSFRAQLSGW